MHDTLCGYQAGVALQPGTVDRPHRGRLARGLPLRGLRRRRRLEETGGPPLAGLDYTPFRPFAHRPDETRYIRLDTRPPATPPASGMASAASTPSLHYRILGRTRTAHLPFDEVGIAIHTSGSRDH